MVSTLLRWVTCTSLILLATSRLSAADLDVYREFKLGNSTAAVVAGTRAMERDLKTLHQRPALLQELVWRPPYVMNSGASARDSVRGMVFSFVDNRLFRIVVDYEATRTEGLSKEDMIALLVSRYGPVDAAPPARAAERRSMSGPIDAPTVIAQWRRGDTEVVLQHFAFSKRFGLMISSVPLDARARQAQADAVALDVREAPAREATRIKTEAEAARTATEKTRTANKAAFQP